MTIYDIIQTSINYELEKFINAVNEKYSLEIKLGDVKNTTKKTKKPAKTRPKKLTKKRKSILNFIEDNTVELKCRELDEKRVVYKNYIIDKKLNCVIGKLNKDNTECFLTKDDCEECKDMNLKYIFN